MPGAPTIFDEHLVRRRLERAARAPSPPDFLLERVEDDLLERLAIIRREFADIACFGAYNGDLARRLGAVSGYRAVTVVPASRRAYDVIEAAAGSAADMPIRDAAPDVLPFAPHSLDLVVSALWLHVLNDLPGVLAQAQRALRPDGLLLASLLGGATLSELRSSWLVAEEQLTGGASPRVAPFADVRDLGALLQRAGFALPVADADSVVVTYESPLHMMQDIKAMGMSNMLAARRRVPVSRALMLRAAEVYVERFAQPDGRVPATFEIITLTGWVPHESQQKPLRPGSAAVSLADVLKASRADREAEE